MIRLNLLVAITRYLRDLTRYVSIVASGSIVEEVCAVIGRPPEQRVRRMDPSQVQAFGRFRFSVPLGGSTVSVLQR